MDSSDVSFGFLREEKKLEVDLRICGNPAKSSKISNPRESNANAVAGPTPTPRSVVKIPTMPNSWKPAPAGVMGTKPKAVTNGWIRK